MKLDQTNNIIHFAVAYLLSFTCIYTYLFFDIRGFLIVLLLLAFISLPSLLAVILLYYLSNRKKIKINKAFYILLSILLFMPAFLIFDKLSYDPRNIFPIFEEPKHMIYVLCFVANLFALAYLELLNKISNKNGVEHRV